MAEYTYGTFNDPIIAALFNLGGPLGEGAYDEEIFWV